MTILLLNVCREKLHYFEFVKPIEKILEKNRIDFYTKHYTKFNDKDLKANKIIICGTSLKDKDYLENINLFKWIDFYKKPILGICAGMQIIAKHFRGELYEKTEVGFTEVKTTKDFFGIKKDSKLEVYSLHKLSAKLNDGFETLGFSDNEKTSQIIKHKEKDVYGVLFHPEARNKEIIENFALG